MSEILLGTVFLTALLLLLTGAVLGARSVLAPRRPATITVNGMTRIAAQTGERLLGALNDQGVLVPSACAGAGTCGLCRVKLTGSTVEAGPAERARLSRAEIAEGQHLACQVVIRGDLGVQVDEALLGAESYDCTVTGTRHLTQLIREIVLQLPDGHRPDIVAGSFVQVTAPPFRLDFAELDIPEPHEAAWAPLRGLAVRSDAPVTRAYSISDRPEDIEAGRIVLDIRLALPPPQREGLPPGIVSSWLFGLREGDRVTTSGPFGSVRVQPTEREMVFIGGGVGMAPLRAMIHEQLERHCTTRHMSFWYGARSRGELFYREELDDLARRHPNFRWTVVLSDPAPGDDWEGETGFVHTVVWQRFLKEHPAPEDCEYYLCGPPLMIEAVLAMLEDAGVEPGMIFNDDFGV